MLISSNFGIFGQFLDVVGQQVYFQKEHFIDYHILFAKHTKLFLFWRNRSFSNSLILLVFADVSENQRCYGNKLYTNKLHLVGSTSCSSLTIRALTGSKLDQSQTGSIEDLKNANIIKISFFGQYSTVVEQHSQVERHVTYIYFEIPFYWLSYPFYKT